MQEHRVLAATILGPTNAIGGNLEIIVNALGLYRSIGGICQDNPGPKSAGPIQGHRGPPPKTSWTQPMASVEIIPGALGAPTKTVLGPANVIGRNYSKSAGPIQEHRGHPPKKLWAQLMSSVDIILSLLGPYRSIRGTRRNSSGPSRWRRQTLFRVYWAHTWPLGAPTENMLGPANVISRKYSKSAGPIQEHQEHPQKQFWAELMASVDIIPSLLGLYRGIGGTHRKYAGPSQFCWAHTGASGEPTEKTLGPADVIGKNYSKSAGPIQEYRGNLPKNILGPADVIGRNYSKSAGPMQEH
ncbi:hypothetical protein BJV77DRAFT_963268 [Russula vinacea]|nr:hypothetical protein BJV77DRAFT_963268 [Russula vinacea]